MTTYLLITGSRGLPVHHGDLLTILREHVEALELEGRVIVYHGDCPPRDGSSVDKAAGRWGFLHGHEVRPRPADWLEHGAAAGPIRNSAMVAEISALAEPGDRRVCLALPGEGSTGTPDCLGKARRAGFECHEDRRWLRQGDLF